MIKDDINAILVFYFHVINYPAHWCVGYSGVSFSGISIDLRKYRGLLCFYYMVGTLIS